MKLDALLSDLKALGVEVSVDGQDLLVDAPDGALSDNMVERIRDSKADLIAYLLARAAQREQPEPLLSHRQDYGRGSFPLSPAQARLWYLDQFEGSSAAYNLPFAYLVDGAIDLGRLEAATKTVIHNQPALRTIFEEVDGEPRQVLVSDFEISVTSIEIPEPLGSPGVDSAVIDFCIDPFDLTEGPLIRAALIATSDRKAILVYVVHHIVFDGTSVELFESQLRHAYESGDIGQLPGRGNIDFLDYVLWQEAHLTEAVIEERLTYWTRALEGATSPIDLPTDFSRPPEPTYDGGRVRVSVDGSLLSAVRECANKLRVSPFMVIMAAYACALIRYSQGNTVVIGYPVANRKHAETQDMVGLFVNTLPLRVTAELDTSFESVLQNVRTSVLEGLAHADLPFERLVEEINPVRDLSRSPIFQVFASIVERESDAFSIGGATFSRYAIPLPVSRVDLSMFSTSYKDHIDLVVEYATDLFERGSAQRFIDVLRQVLVRGTNEPSADIRALTNSSSEELERQLHDWNQTDVDFGDFCRVDELISAHLATPGKAAVITRDNSTSYAELEASVNQLANHLVQNGIHPGDIVGVHMDRTLDMVIALLAILRCGAGYLPLDPAFPQDRLEYMLSDSGAKGLITHGAIRRPLKFETGLIVDLDSCRDRLMTLSSERPSVQSGTDDVAYILYTSGSTGKPKGVVVPHRCVTNFLYSMQREPGLTENDVLLAVTTMSFDISVLEIFLPLMSGATVFLATAEDALDGNRLADLLDRANATVMQATPSTWHMLLESGWRGRAGLKCLCGGEALTNKLASQLHAKCDELWNLYGPTETTVWSTCVRVTDPNAPILVGKPIANTQVYILDVEMNPQPIGVPGELYIGGDGVGLGYMNREELTASVFVDDPFSDVPGRKLYRTGDLARWRNDGQLQHLGRTGSQVKIRGFRIELGEIESVLDQHDSISNVACSVWSPSDGDQRLVAHCVVAEGYSLAPTELRKHLRKSVPDYMVPQHFEPIAEIPLTANGKIDRKSLPSPTLASSKSASSPPESPGEILVAGIWADILGIETVNRHDNFFDIGGHSLLAVRAAAAIESASGHRPELREFVLDDLSLIARRIPESRAIATDEKESRSLLSRLLGR